MDVSHDGSHGYTLKMDVDYQKDCTIHTHGFTIFNREHASIIFKFWYRYL